GMRGVVGLSVLTASLAGDGATADGRGAWMVAARRSHVDLLTRAAAGLGASAHRIPYAFGDLTARGDLRLTSRWALESSVLAEGDALRAAVPGVVEAAAGRWGAAAGRVTLVRQTS